MSNWSLSVLLSVKVSQYLFRNAFYYEQYKKVSVNNSISTRESLEFNEISCLIYSYWLSLQML